MEYVFTAPTDRGVVHGYAMIEHDGRLWVIGPVFLRYAGGHRLATAAKARQIRAHLYKHHALKINSAWLKWRGIEPHRSFGEYLKVRGVE